MKLIKHYWICAMLVLCPIVYDPAGGQLRPFQEHFLQYASIGFACLFLENIWLTLFMLWNIFLYIYAGGVVGSMQVLNIFFGCLVFRFARAWFKKNKFDNCYGPICITLVLSLLFLILQKLHLDPLSVPQNGAQQVVDGPMTQACGLFGIPMAHGIFLAMCMPIVASMNIWLAPLLLIPIYMTQSSAAMLAALTASGFYLFHTTQKKARGWVLGVLAFLVIAGVAFVIQDGKTDPNTMHSRFPMWSATIKYALHRPEGYGPDSFRNYNDHKAFKFNSDNQYRTILSYSPKHDDSEIVCTYYSPTNDSAATSRLNDEVTKNGFPKNSSGQQEFNFFDDPHNEYIKVLFEYGIPGVFLLFGLFWEMITRFRKTMISRELITVTSCLIVFAIASVTQFPCSLARLAIFLPFLGGAFYAITDTDGV